MRIRRIVKRVAFLFGLVLASPAIIVTWIEGIISNSRLVFSTCAQLAALIPGPVGVYVRAAYYSAVLHDCSWEVHIGFGSVCVQRRIELGPNVSLGLFCVIGHARIGEGTRIASRVSIPSGKRQHIDGSGNLVPTTNYDTVAIGSQCWIGEGAIIMADVGASSIVCAAAVVTEPAPEGCVIGGHPARVLRELGPDSGSREAG